MAHESNYGLDRIGIPEYREAHWNLTPPALYEHALRNGEAEISAGGPLLAVTTPHTGRSPKDKAVVREPASENDVWWGDVNKPLDPEKRDLVRKDLIASLKDKTLYVRDCYGGSDPEHRLRVRIVTEYAWHNLFAYNMFIQPRTEELEDFVPDFTVIDSPSFQADPAVHGTNSETCIVLSFDQNTVLIGGTRYAGEIKKSVFTVLNFLLPSRNVLPMHCSANVGPDGDSAVFFGLSGTGKTTLSADPARALIGDDEHGWSDDGIFNFEGGCYAKIIKLNAENEPQIYATTRRFGSIVENTVIDGDSRELDLDDDSITENTRVSYPLHFIPGIVESGRAGHPKSVVFLTCDAFGVLPPISKLTPAQAAYHFLSGYTAKVAGTERGVKEPTATFSACFGAPFLPRPPQVYAEMLSKKIAQHGARCWLVNTGWSGGPYGVGERMKLPHTRAMLNAALRGDLDNVPSEPDPIFGVAVPSSCPGVPADVLRPQSTWQDQASYQKHATKLAGMFRENFKQFEADASKEIIAAAPKG